MKRSRHRRPSRRAIFAAAMLLTAGLSPLAVAGPAVAASPYGFDKPKAIASSGGNLWIANYGGNSVTETNSAGKWIRTIRGPKYGFEGPDAIVSYRADLFVVNHAGSVTELNASTGGLVRIIQGANYHFASPGAIAEQGGNLWVVDTATSAVTEFSAASGAFIRTLSDTNTHYGFKAPDAIAAAGTNIWVVSKSGGSATDANAGAVTELVASSGAFVRRVSAAADGLEKPSGVAFDGKHVWVSDAATDAVTELAANGALVRVVTNSSLDANYGFDAPTVVVAKAPDVYVISPPGASPMVTQITASTAEGNWFECNTNTPDPNFNNPTGLIVQGGYVWVVSPGNNTLTQLSLALGGNRVHLFT